MALSYEQYLGTGSRTKFDFSFEYLSKSHVKASVDGVDVPLTWDGMYSVNLVPAPLPGSVVEVRRTTPRTERLVRFTDGSTLVATDLNVSTLQAFFLAQEAFDQGAASLAVTEDGQYSAQTRRVTYLGDPLNPEDAVNKRWAETAMGSQLAAATAAKDAALVSRNSANADAVIATAERVAAQTARTASEAARDSASGHRLNAQNAETASKEARDITLAARDVTVAARDVTVSAKDVAVQKAAEAAASALSVDAANLLNKSGNLDGLTDLPTARLNLGLGNIATRNITISTEPPTGGADGDLWVQV